MMINLMLSDIGNFFKNWWLILVLLVLIVVMWVVSIVRRKKYNEQTTQMQNELKPGTKVKTYSGFYGKIISIKETTDGKVALLEMGEGSKLGYITVDVNAIYGVDQKEEVVYDKDGNIIVKENRNKKEKSNDDKNEDFSKSEEITKPEEKEEKKSSNLEEYETFEEKKSSKKDNKSKKQD